MPTWQKFGQYGAETAEDKKAVELFMAINRQLKLSDGALINQSLLDSAGPRTLRNFGLKVDHLVKGGDEAATYSVYMNIRNPLRVDEPIPIRDVVAIFGPDVAKKLDGKYGYTMIRDKTDPYKYSHHDGHIVYDKGMEELFYSLPEEERNKRQSAAGSSSAAAKVYMQERLIVAGYDGITHIGGDVMGGGHHHRVWIAFEPTQIKSTANRGTFDASTGRIDLSLAVFFSSTELLDLPDIRQKDHYSCGAAVAMAVGRYFNVGPTSLEEWKHALGTSEKNSTSPPAIIRYLRSLGLDVTARPQMTIEDLHAAWQDGKPVICPIQEYGVPSKQASFNYGHYVVVIGQGLGEVFVFDPSIDNALAKPGGTVGKGKPDPDVLQAPGRSLIPVEKWMKVWHDRDAAGRRYVQYGIVVGGNRRQVK